MTLNELTVSTLYTRVVEEETIDLGESTNSESALRNMSTLVEKRICRLLAISLQKSEYQGTRNFEHHIRNSSEPDTKNMNHMLRDFSSTQRRRILRESRGSCFICLEHRTGQLSLSSASAPTVMSGRDVYFLN